MRNLPKWPVLVTLVPVRALSETRFLSARESTENDFSFSALKKGTHKFASNACNGIVLFLTIGAFFACSLTCFWMGIRSHNNAHIGIANRSSCFQTGTRLHNNARIGITVRSSLSCFCTHCHIDARTVSRFRWMAMHKWQMTVHEWRSPFVNSYLKKRKFAHYDTRKERHSDKWPAKFGFSPIWALLCVKWH